MTNFILDGTSLPFPKQDLVPLGSAPTNKYTSASDWNTVCQASVDMQTFLRGNFLLFKNGDPTVRAELLLTEGAPAMVAEKGALAIDVSTPAIYQNQDGAATWLPFGGGGGGMTIGAPVTSGTAGSALYVGPGALLAQDNANYYYDGVNKRLGVGTGSPGTTLDLSSPTTTAGLAMRAGSTTGVSAASTGRLRYNEATNAFQVSLNGAAYVDLQTGADFTLDVGDAIGSSTVGSLLFVGAGNLLAQDNTNLFWDDTNNALSVISTSASAAVHARNAHATSGAMSIRNTNVSGPVDFYAIDSGGTARMSWGYGNASYADAARASRGYVWRDTGIDFVFARTSTYDILIPALGGMEFTNSTSAVSSANTGRLRYTTTGQKFQVSYNGGAYVDLATGTGMAIGTAVTGATQGSVLFAGAATVLAQDNANFFWDDANNRLGIGTAVPSCSLDARSNTTNQPVLQLTNTLGTGYSSADFYTSAVAFAGGLGYGNAAVAITHLRTNLYLYSAGASFVIANATRNNFTFGTVDATAFMEIANGSSAAPSSADTGRFRYDAGGQKLQLSNNGVAYANVTRSAAALTAGSVPFVNASDQLTQDNANFFWDDTNNRLGVGTAVPGTTLDISSATTTAGLAMRAGSTTAVSAAGTGRVRYDEGSNRFQASLNGVAYVDLVTQLAAAGTANTLAKYTAAGVIADSAVTDDGTFVSVGRAQTFFGSTFGETYISGPAVNFFNNTDADAVGIINQSGYGQGITRFRSLQIQDGKNAVVATFNGSAKSLALVGNLSTDANLSAGSTDGAVHTSRGNLTVLKTGVDSIPSILFTNDAKTWSIGVDGTVNDTFHVTEDGVATWTRWSAGGLLVHGGAAQIDGTSLFNNTTSQKAHANFAGSGSVQITRAQQTTDDTQTHITALTLADTFAAWLVVEVAGRDAAGVERAMYGKAALVYREGGGATIQGAVQDVHADVETTAGLDATITVSGNDVRVSVTGLAATTINWVTTIRYQAVSGNA